MYGKYVNTHKHIVRYRYRYYVDKDPLIVKRSFKFEGIFFTVEYQSSIMHAASLSLSEWCGGRRACTEKASSLISHAVAAS